MNAFSAGNPQRAALMWLAYHGEGATLRGIARLAGISAPRVRQLIQEVDARIDRSMDRWLRSRTPYGVFPRCRVGCDCWEHPAPVFAPPPEPVEYNAFGLRRPSLGTLYSYGGRR